MIDRNPAEDLKEYADAVMKLYLQLPETPLKPSTNDRQTTENLRARRIHLKAVESALLLGTIRRLSRSPDMPPLSPIRSLAYFLPVIEEIRLNPVPNDYLEYLRKKVGLLSSRAKTIKQR
jgi:hypothetical protein